MTDATAPALPRTIGIDLGDSNSHGHILPKGGGSGEEFRIRTEERAFRTFFEAQEPSRIIIEACGHSHWVARLLQSLGHEVIVSNPRRLRLIAESSRKTDRNDARLLAEFGQVRPTLLSPVRLRGPRCQATRAFLKARIHLVEVRTRLINFVRGEVKTWGGRIRTCSSAAFHHRARPDIPTELKIAVIPILDQLAEIQARIVAMDKEIARMAEEDFPETQLLTQVNGIGALIALAFVSVIEDPGRFPDPRSVGAYLGLVPKARDSGKSKPSTHISKEGDIDLRRLLVNSATRLMSRLGEPCDLKRFGERIAAGGTRRDKGRARIAVARKYAVLLVRLWKNGLCYDRNHSTAPAA